MKQISNYIIEKFKINSKNVHKSNDIENKINNELFKTNININFSKSKSEILNFMKLCLPYPEYFNTHEISLLLIFIILYQSCVAQGPSLLVFI